jgi:hypothetical protein
LTDLAVHHHSRTMTKGRSRIMTTVHGVVVAEVGVGTNMDTTTKGKGEAAVITTTKGVAGKEVRGSVMGQDAVDGVGQIVVAGIKIDMPL